MKWMKIPLGWSVVLSPGFMLRYAVIIGRYSYEMKVCSEACIMAVAIRTRASVTVRQLQWEGLWNDLE